MNIATHQVILHRSNAKRLFVTGTDTGVGKTVVSSAIIAALRRAGRRVAAIKPIETGCAHDGERLLPADGARLAEAAGLPLDAVSPIRYALPVSPEAAAAAEGRPVDLAAIDRAVDALPPADLVVIEGAGGLLAPVDAHTTMADLALRLGARLLIVARASLGTINHTLLTVEAAERRGLEIAGIVLNRVVAEAGPDEPTNPQAIAARARPPILGTMPHLPGAPLAALAEAAARLDLARL